MSQKISDMTVATSLVDSVVPIVQGGANKKASQNLISPAQILQSTTRRHGPTRQTNALGTGALTINSLRASYMILTEYSSIDTIGIEMTVGAGGNIWVGIYEVNTATGEPTNLIGWSGVLSAAVGVREGWTLVAASNKLKPGVYALVYLTDTANTARTVNTFADYFAGLPSTYGGSQAVGWIVALAYTATPPNPFTAGGALVNSLTIPFIGCRLIAF